MFNSGLGKSGLGKVDRAMYDGGKIMRILYARKSKGITLEQALKDRDFAIFPDGIALLYSPTCCQFAKLQNGGSLINPENDHLNLKDIFEARVFNQNRELRWLNQTNGKGQAVLISEQDISNYLSESLPNLTAIDIIEQQYLLWGKGVKNTSNHGWGKLAESRIGSISVPVTGLIENQRVYLKTVEYLQADEENGNVSVVEERLIKLEVK